MNNDFNNGYGNQTPPENNGNSDYSYRWNGSEHNGGKKPWKVFLIIAIVISAIAVIAVGASYASEHIDDIIDVSSDNSRETSRDTSRGDSSEDVSERPEYSVPDFSQNSDDDPDSPLTAVYEKCAPSCCTIHVTYDRKSGYAFGSGFVIDAENGYIATNHHVIEDADHIKVMFYNGDEYDGTVVGSDSVTDLAVIKIDADPKKLVEIELGDSNKLKPGQTVVAIGTPCDEEFAGSMTCGIISGIARDVAITNDYGTVVKRMTLIQTDCTINFGNSGGPLINQSGCVVGINSIKIAGDYENLGFAIPISEAVEIFKKLIAGEEIGESGIATASAKIGIEVTSVSNGLDAFHVRPTCEYPEDGAFVYSLTTYNSNAYRAGLLAGDIITVFNGEEIKNYDELSEILGKCHAGQEVTIKVFRFNSRFSEGKYIEFTFKLDAAS